MTTDPVVIRGRLTELMVHILHDTECPLPRDRVLSAAEVNDHVPQGERRYRSDPVFRARVDTAVALIWEAIHD